LNLLHASCVAINNKGVLIAGPPGAGKSDLALRLIDEGAVLVADDQTELKIRDGGLIASAPAAIRGLIEVRHVGLLKLPHAAEAPIALYVELAGMDQKLERLPGEEHIMLLDHPVRRLRLPAFAASTEAKIRTLLKGLFINE
jgi:serine kinase of HPr protein (carbohydrate metabolism regulator)